jgi:hypothetical protein
MKYLILSLTLLATACGGDSSTAPGSGAVVRFAFDGNPRDTMRVLITDPATIEAARAYIRTKQGAHIPIGPIVIGAGIDARYPYHFDPDAVRLAELAIEVCDGAPMRTPAEVAAFIQGSTGSTTARATWCPWGGRPVSIEGE